MTALNCAVRLEYNSFYIAGSRDVDLPTAFRGTCFATNASCINVGCRLWQEGEIEIVLGTTADPMPEGAPALDTSIRTPRNQVLLFDANHPELLRCPVENRRTRIRIWTNHPTEPDRVTLVIGG
ncbi:MAG: hypothetical protein JJ913_06380 [Rhizobiaceae bacterium]|nr:hypothetical protein [Rhizobiaceae bacterium]